MSCGLVNCKKLVSYEHSCVHYYIMHLFVEHNLTAYGHLWFDDLFHIGCFQYQRLKTVALRAVYEASTHFILPSKHFKISGGWSFNV